MRTWILTLALACAPEPTTSTDTDGGLLCRAEEGTVTIDFQVCLSSSCDTVTSQSCTIAVEAGVATVTSEIVITSEGGACTADCGMVSDTCGALDAAITAVQYGGATVTLEPCGG